MTNPQPWYLSICLLHIKQNDSICHVGSFPFLSSSPGENWMLIILLYLMSLLVKQKLRSRKTQNRKKIGGTDLSRLSGTVKLSEAEHNSSQQEMDLSPGTVEYAISWSKDHHKHRRWICKGQCISQCVCVCVCSGMLCVWLSAAAFLHQNSHLPRTLHALCSLLLFYFFFFFAFLILHRG